MVNRLAEVMHFYPALGCLHQHGVTYSTLTLVDGEEDEPTPGLVSETQRSMYACQLDMPSTRRREKTRSNDCCSNRVSSISIMFPWTYVMLASFFLTCGTGDRSAPYT